MTVQGDQSASQIDPQASLRAELAGQIAAAQLALDAAIAELTQNGGNLAAITTLCLERNSLTSLRQQVGSATGSALADLRAEVTAAASSASALAQQATGSSASASNAADPLTRAAAARQAIEEVGRKLFDDKVLDPYLVFASKHDEEAYRKREGERNEAFNRALALGTPEGDRLARQIALEQHRDAGAHGADRSPDFAPMQREMARASADLDAATLSTKNDQRQQTSGRKDGHASASELDDVMAALNAAGVTTSDQGATGSKHGLGERRTVSRTQSGTTIQV